MYGISGMDLSSMFENGSHMGEKSPYGGKWIKCLIWDKGQRKGWDGHTIITVITAGSYVKYHRYFTQSTGQNGGFAHGLSMVGKYIPHSQLERDGFKARATVWMETGTDAIRFDEPKEGIDF